MLEAFIAGGRNQRVIADLAIGRVQITGSIARTSESGNATGVGIMAWRLGTSLR